MLAEIHRKISQSGTNLSERLEDKLTGDFFGSIRYLPFEYGLKQVLEKTVFSNEVATNSWTRIIQSQSGYPAEWSFWQREDEGEIDLMLTFDDVLVGIEVKYLSNLSSEDSQPIVGYKESVNQIARYSTMLERLAGNRQAYLLFLAPYELMKNVEERMNDRSIVSPFVQLGYLCWEDLHEALKEVDCSSLERGQQFIIHDLQQLLAKKELMRFSGFERSQVTSPISTHSYIFKETDEASSATWSWTNQTILEGKSYVYNNN